MLLSLAACLLHVSGALAQRPDLPLLLPGSMAYDSAGDLFFAESGRHQVRELTAAGQLFVVAGDGSQGFRGDGGRATAASFDTPEAVAVDGAGVLYIADTHNHRIRQVDPGSGVVTTYAPAASPVALAFDPGGNLVYADASLHQVMRIATSGGEALAIAGDGRQGRSGDGGMATSAELDSPGGLAFDAAGDLLIADTHNHCIRIVDARTGLIATLPGSTAVQLPRQLAVDASGNVYVADEAAHVIGRIDALTGAERVVAGSGTEGFAGDGSPAQQALLSGLRGVALSPAGGLVLADTHNNRIRQVDGAGSIATLAGAGAVAPVSRKASSVTTLTAGSGQTVYAEVKGPGVPSGSVILFDGITAVGATTLSAAGLATFSTSSLSSGTHTLSCAYAGDSLFLPSVSPPLLVSVSPLSPADFVLASSGPSELDVLRGSPAVYAFVVTPTGAALVSKVALSLSGLPAGSVASFSPGFLPPPSGPAPIVLSITTPLTVSGAVRHVPESSPSWGAVCLLVGLLVRQRRGPRPGWLRRGVPMSVTCVLGVSLLGCGARVHPGSSVGRTSVTYNMMVTATATSLSGGTLLHSVPVTLTLE